SDKENAKFKHKCQRRDPGFDDVKNFYSEPYLRKGDVTTNNLQVFVVQERTPCIWKQSVKSLDSLRWLPSNWKSIRWLSTKKVKTRPRQKMDQSLVTSTEQKSLITKLSITSYLCGFYVKQSHGPLFKRKWAATFGRVIYLDLQEAMLHCLKATNSKFTLIHDVWTTKGNRFGFIGAS
ncbi:hypothetical protein VP01_9383g1, partial [Puccinia sorghi]